MPKVYCDPGLFPAMPNWLLRCRIGCCDDELVAAMTNWFLRCQIGYCDAELLVAMPNWLLRCRIGFCDELMCDLTICFYKLTLVCALGVVPPIVCRKRRYVRRAHHARRLPELRWCVRWGIMPPSDCQNSVGACVGDTLVLLPIVCQIYVGACVGDYSS